MKRIPAARIRSVWQNPGLTTTEAAAQVGLTRVNLWRRAKALGLPPRKCGRRWRIGNDSAVEFARMWLRGDLIADIARHFGVYDSAVIYRCRSLGLPLRGNAARHCAAGREDEFAAMWAAGVRTVDIAARFGAKSRTILERARKMGLPPRGRGRAHLSIDAWLEMQLAERMAKAAQREQSVARARGLRDRVPQ